MRAYQVAQNEEELEVGDSVKVIAPSHEEAAKWYVENGYEPESDGVVVVRDWNTGETKEVKVEGGEG